MPGWPRGRSPRDRRPRHDDGDRPWSPLGGQGCRRAAGDDHVRLETDQFGGEIGKPLVLPLGPPVLDDDVLPLDVAELTQPLSEGVRAPRWSAAEPRPKADPTDLRCCCASAASGAARRPPAKVLKNARRSTRNPRMTAYLGGTGRAVSGSNLHQRGGRVDYDLPARAGKLLTATLRPLNRGPRARRPSGRAADGSLLVDDAAHSDEHSAPSRRRR